MSRFQWLSGEGEPDHASSGLPASVARYRLLAQLVAQRSGGRAVSEMSVQGLPSYGGPRPEPNDDRGRRQSEAADTARRVYQGGRGGRPQDGMHHRLGSLSERYETGGRGPGTINLGTNDPGGASYGLYQLASRSRQPQAFLREEGSRWAAEFDGAAPGTAAFNRVWANIAAREPQAFGEAQHAFIERTHYRPAVERIRENTGIDLDARSNAIRDATWSMAVQHGATPKLITVATRAADKIEPNRRSPRYDEALLRRMYEERAVLLKLLSESPGRNAGQRRTHLNDLRIRVPAERSDALNMLRSRRGR